MSPDNQRRFHRHCPRHGIVESPPTNNATGLLQFEQNNRGKIRFHDFIEKPDGTFVKRYDCTLHRPDNNCGCLGNPPTVCQDNIPNPVPISKPRHHFPFF